MPNARYVPRPEIPCSRGRANHITRDGHPACKAHKKDANGGACCRREPIVGSDVCYSHGGANRASRAKADRVKEARMAAKVLRRFGEPVDTSPTEALLDAVRWTAGYVAWLRDKVASLGTDDELVWGRTREKTGGDDYGTTEEAKPNAWLVLLGDWHDRLVKICAEAIKAGIEERRVRIAEQQGALVASAIQAILDDLALTPAQAERVPEVVPRHLRALAG